MGWKNIFISEFYFLNLKSKKFEKDTPYTIFVVVLVVFLAFGFALLMLLSNYWYLKLIGLVFLLLNIWFGYKTFFKRKNK